MGTGFNENFVFEKWGKSVAVNYLVGYNGAKVGSEVHGGVNNIINTRKCREKDNGG